MYKKELDSGTLLFVEVPMDAYDFKLEDGTDYSYWSTMDECFSKPHKFYHSIPEGNWQLLGYSLSLTEEQLKDVMELFSITRMRSFCYKDYVKSVGTFSSFTCQTPLESFQSLKSSLGLDGKKLIVLFNPKK